MTLFLSNIRSCFENMGITMWLTKVTISFKYMSVLRKFFFENNETAIFSFFQNDRVRTKNENGFKLIQKKIAARLSM